MIRTPIFLSLSPNTETDDLLSTLRVMIAPWQWKNGRAIPKAEEWFCTYCGVSDAPSFNSGRSALLALLAALGIGPGDDVLIQAFTCVAVSNSILWARARPVYVDIDATLNMDPDDAERKVTAKTRAIIVQHTFGVPAQMDRLIAFARKQKIFIIEDCAHGLGAEYRGRPIGTLGDAAFFSFGRDKVLSSVFGGVAVIADTFRREQKKLRRYQEKLSYPSYAWIGKQLIYPLVCSLIVTTYAYGLGKVLHAVFGNIGILSRALTREERYGKRPPEYPAKYPNALAGLLLCQIRKLGRFTDRRRRIARLYKKTIPGDSLRAVPNVRGSAFLRYPLLTRSPDAVRKSVRRKGIYLGNWYHNVIDPEGVDMNGIFYRRGSCPHAEYAAKHIVNLPTNISQKDGERVVRAL